MKDNALNMFCAVLHFPVWLSSSLLAASPSSAESYSDTGVSFSSPQPSHQQPSIINLSRFCFLASRIMGGQTITRFIGEV